MSAKQSFPISEETIQLILKTLNEHKFVSYGCGGPGGMEEGYHNDDVYDTEKKLKDELIALGFYKNSGKL